MRIEFIKVKRAATNAQQTQKENKIQKAKNKIKIKA